MIWALVSKKEMECCDTAPVFTYYQEAIGKDNIKLAVVEEDDELEFVHHDDIVLLRTASEKLIKTIKKNNIKSTAEDYKSYLLTSDKELLCSELEKIGVNVPHQYHPNDVCDGMIYFVKPRFGHDSIGISRGSICYSCDDVLRQISAIQKDFGDKSVVEDLIIGSDCTVTCLYNQENNELECYPIAIHNEAIFGVQTEDVKSNKTDFCECLSHKEEKELSAICKLVFNHLRLRHHARLDFRKANNGGFYLIDVNLIPGLGPLGYLSRSLLLCENISYKDAILKVVTTATRRYISDNPTPKN